MYILHRSVWDLSLSVMLVYIHWVVSISGGLDLADLYWSSWMAGVGTISPLSCKLFVL